MCGIIGIINLGNRQPIDPALLSMMSDTMIHRGPDDSGVWVQDDGQCGLAHRRLSIMDLSPAGHQPMLSEDQKILVTFNGEIYNYPALRKEFEAQRHTFKSHADTEIILCLYKKYGDRFFEYLDGDFGIGLWDQERQKLILTRDRAGVKPVYYAYVDGRFIFASEIKALLKYPGINKKIDPVAFYHYLTFMVVPSPHTLVGGIKKLEAATTLTLEPSRGLEVGIKKYWEPFPRVNKSRSFADLDEELESLYSAAVEKRLMSDVPVGVLFSGGVDSTLNACAFSKLIAPEKVKTFTIGMDNAGDFHDDSIAARTMAERIGTEHHEVRINEKDLLAATEKLARLQDEPVSDPVSVPLYFVTKFAKDHGVTVLQAGEGADEIFCGYDNYRRFLRQDEKFWRPLSQVPKSFSSIGASALSFSSSPRARKIRDVLARRAKGQEFFMSSAVAYYELEKEKILSKEMQATFGDLDSFDVVSGYYDRIMSECPDASFLQQITFIELQLRLPELLLMRADKMSMANSVEVRVPFLDRDLMDFSMRVPDAYKLRDGVSKEPVKRLASKHVLKEKIYRPKTGFGVPIKEWFRGQLGDALIEMMAEDGSDITKMVDVETIIKRIRQGPRTVNEAFQLWVIYNVLAWQRTL